MYSGNDYALTVKEQVFKIYKDGSFDSLSSWDKNNRVSYHAVMFDNNNKVWLGGLDGLFTCENFKIKPFKQKQFPHRITDLIYNKTWGKLVATREEGLYTFDENKFTKINGLLSNDITYLHCDNQNKLWVGTNKGVNVLTKKKIKQFPLLA
jgi:ligand-binding sensor domain-containing protein